MGSEYFALELLNIENNTKSEETWINVEESWETLITDFDLLYKQALVVKETFKEKQDPESETAVKVEIVEELKNAEKSGLSNNSDKDPHENSPNYNKIHIYKPEPDNSDREKKLYKGN